VRRLDILLRPSLPAGTNVFVVQETSQRSEQTFCNSSTSSSYKRRKKLLLNLVLLRGIDERVVEVLNSRAGLVMMTASVDSR
jgi:acetone carboxylase gamma subunit